MFCPPRGDDGMGGIQEDHKRMEMDDVTVGDDMFDGTMVEDRKDDDVDEDVLRHDNDLTVKASKSVEEKKFIK